MKLKELKNLIEGCHPEDLNNDVEAVVISKKNKVFKSDSIRLDTDSGRIIIATQDSEQYKLNGLLIKFLSFLISKRRFFYVEKILKDFIETCSKKRGEVKAQLTSAKKLSEGEINSIKEELTKNFSSKIKLKYKHDESLIGGLTVQVGCVMVDTSIKNKLQQIENRMIEA